MRHPSLFHLFTPVSRIKGVGAQASEALMRLLPAATQRVGGGLPIIRDLLFHLPVGIIDRRVTYPLSEAPDGVVATFVVTVQEHHAPKRSRFSKKPYKVMCGNDTGSITLVFFHAQEDYLQNALPIGQKRVISGKVERFDFQLQMSHPDIIAPLSQLEEVQKPEAIYPLTVGLTSRRISKLVDQALAALPEMPEWQASQNARAAIPSFKQALMQLHHPQSEAVFAPDNPAKLRIVYDEILAHQLHLALLRRKMAQQAGVVIVGDGSLSQPLMASLPYQLTAGQQQVLADIAADLASGRRMVRLLQGDVGSGKTIVALIAMLKAVEQGLQCALMAPTELIARQHATLVDSLQLAVSSVLLTGSIKGKDREETLAAIKSGAAKIIIGTHALFQEKVEFGNLSLVVIDEQHRFGVEQRMALSKKGDAPHILHMTATPIPRSLTMMIYGDMECSLLKEKPAERKPIATRVIPRSRYEEVVTRLQSALDRGEKAYWICPLVEESWQRDTWNVAREALPHAATLPRTTYHDDLAAATSRYKEFQARFGDIVSLVHGRMKAEERDREMQKFASGESKLLVATTVVEVGVDVRDATIMVVEQAERFGLSQLHQLRGRVGRGEKESACVLLYTEPSLSGRGQGEGPHPNLLPEGEGAIRRLSILRETEDGFRIAEEDLKLRGGGELLGVRQSGQEGTIFVDIGRHAALIAKARDEAAVLLEKDPHLASAKGQAAELLLQLFEREV